jgi:hypothetical protein
MKNFRLSLDEASKVLRNADCHNDNSTISKVVMSLQGGINDKQQDHLKGHGDVSWDKYSAATLQQI